MEIKSLIYFTLIFILVIIKVIWDTYNNKILNRVINHTTSTWIDGIVYFLFSLLVFGFSPLVIIYHFMVALMMRFTIFEQLFYRATFRPYDYIGTTSDMDIFLGKYNIAKYIVIFKVVLLSLLIIFNNQILNILK